MTLEERYTTFRAKIELQNDRKSDIKYTYPAFTLDGLFKTLFLSPEVTKFKAAKRCWMVSTASGSKIEDKFTCEFL